MDDEARVRTEKTGRIGHEAMTEATYVFDRRRAALTDTAFSYRQAFSFAPGRGSPKRGTSFGGSRVAPKEKALND